MAVNVALCPTVTVCDIGCCVTPSVPAKHSVVVVKNVTAASAAADPPGEVALEVPGVAATIAGTATTASSAAGRTTLSTCLTNLGMRRLLPSAAEHPDRRADRGAPRPPR